MREAASPTRLVLAGVGHANLEVLRRFSSRGLAGVDLTVISPGPLHLYSGMVPGYLRGTYRVEEIAVEVAPLVRAAGGRVLLGRAVGLDPGRRLVRVVEAADDGATSAADGGVVVGGGIREVPYDLVAFAVGSDAVGAAAASARGGGAVLSCKPIGRAIELRRRLDFLAGEGHPPATVAVVGGGAAGVEIALAAAGRLGSSAAGRLGPSAASGLSASAVGGRGTSATRHRVLLLEARPAILADRSPRLRRRAEEVLQRRGVELRTGSKVVEVNPPGEAAGPPGRAVLRLSGGEEISCNLVVWVTAATGWPLFHEAGLPLDGRGFLLVDGALRSVADPRVFAAGDCATLAAFPGTAKAGVYAVREGPVLARALRAALAGEPPPRYRPQRGFLVILNTGDGRALLSYKGFVSYSRWAFRLKDRIDRGFVAKYRPRGQEESTGETGEERRDGSSGGI